MEWLNQGVGLIVVISSVVIVLLLAVMLVVLLILRNKIAVQRLTFLGFFSTDHKTRERYADCTIGNRSLNEIALAEIGVSNGGVSFNLTELYKHKANLGADARIVIEQRSSIRFSLTKHELLPLLVDGKHGKELKTLRLYAVDLTGNRYRGNIRSVRNLLAELMAEEKAAENASAITASHTCTPIVPQAPEMRLVPLEAAKEPVVAETPAQAPAEGVATAAEAPTQAPTGTVTAAETPAQAPAKSTAPAAAHAEPGTSSPAGSSAIPQAPATQGTPAGQGQAHAEAPVPAPTAEEVAPALPVPGDAALQGGTHETDAKE